jgi:hypothetical protein
VIAVHIRIEGTADRFADACASVIVRVLQHEADGAEPRHVTEQVPLGKRAGNIERPYIDSGPSALVQDGVDPIAIRERELPGAI